MVTITTVNLPSTKKVLVNKEETEVNETFYFTVFADEAMTLPVKTESLKLDGESSGQITVNRIPFGTFYFAETDKDGNPVGSDFAYKAEVSASTFTISDAKKNVVINVTNSKETDDDEETTVTTTPSANDSSASGSGSSTAGSKTADHPKTGDDTPVGFYTLMLLAAATMIFAAKRRKKSER